MPSSSAPPLLWNPNAVFGAGFEEEDTLCTDFKDLRLRIVKSRSILSPEGTGRDVAVCCLYHILDRVTLIQVWRVKMQSILSAIFGPSDTLRLKLSEIESFFPQERQIWIPSRMAD